MIASAEGDDIQATSAPVTVTWTAGGTTETPAAGTLAAPSLVSPAPGASQSSLGPLLQWTNPPGTTQFELQVIPVNNDGPGFDLILNAADRYQVAPPALGAGNYTMLPGMSYSWRVRVTSATTSVGQNDPGWSAWSEARMFQTAVRTSTGIRALAPATGSIVSEAQPALQWDNSDKDVFYYEIQVSGDTRFDPSPETATSFVWWNLVHGGVSDPLNSWRPPAVEAGTTYYWRVRPRVQGDGATVGWSQTWSFKTP